MFSVVCVQLKAAIEKELVSTKAHPLAASFDEEFAESADDFGASPRNQLGKSLISEDDKKLDGSML